MSKFLYCFKIVYFLINFSEVCEKVGVFFPLLIAHCDDGSTRTVGFIVTHNWSLFVCGVSDAQDMYFCVVWNITQGQGDQQRFCEASFEMEQGYTIMSKNSNVGDAFPSALSFSTVSYANDYLTTTRRPLASLPPVPECSTNANAIDHTGESFTRIDSGKIPRKSRSTCICIPLSLSLSFSQMTCKNPLLINLSL